MDIQERVAGVVEALKESYPDPRCALEYEKDYELMIAVRLSAQCTDERVNLVTPALFARYPTLESLAQADISEVEGYVRSCGFYHNKARDIVLSCQMLLERFGGRIPGTMEELLTLPGVGRKTANLILGDIFGKPAIVCDTHCIRLSNRLGFVRDEKDPVKVEKALRGLVTPAESSDFCHRLVLFGREHCTARAPRCTDCPLADICPSFGKMR